MYKKLREEGSFPSIWKVVKLVLIEIEKKTDSAKMTYRPLCSMFTTLTKLLEQMISNRITNEMVTKQFQKEQIDHQDNYYIYLSKIYLKRCTFRYFVNR